MRSPVTALIEQYKALTDVEQKVFLDLVDPQPEAEAPVKRGRKKAKRAEPLSDDRRKAVQRKGLPLLNTDPDAVPTADSEDPKCNVCGNAKDYQDHFKPSPNYHEFEAPKSKKAAQK